MNPTATPAALAAAASGNLAAADAALLVLCDGRADLELLGTATGLGRAHLLDRLDALADAGLLSARAAPPTGLSRRGLLGGLLGASAAVVAAALPRVARAEPAATPPGLATCIEPQTIDLELAEPSKLLAGPDPAYLQRTAAALAVGGLEGEIDAGDAETLALAKAAAELADLADAHASLTLEAAADGWIGYSAAAALGDPGPIGREGDVATGIAQSALRARESRAKQSASEHMQKGRLASHDEETAKTFERRAGAHEQAEKAMMRKKVGSEKEQEENAKKSEKAYLYHEEKAKAERQATERQRKDQSMLLFDDTEGKEKIAYFVKRIDEASRKLQTAGNTLDARLLDGAMDWATTDLEPSRRLQEQEHKKRIRERLDQDLKRGISGRLAEAASEELAKRENALQRPPREMLAKKMHEIRK